MSFQICFSWAGIKHTSVFAIFLGGPLTAIHPVLGPRCYPPSAGMSVAFIAFFGAGASAAAFFAPFFAMLIALNLQTSFLTPPMAMSAYYLKGVQKHNVELMEIFAGIMPFLGIVIFAMSLMYMFPGIALWLPETLFAN